MPAALDLSGRRFGRLTVKRLAGERKYGKRQWQCDCTCGGKTVVVGSDLVSGNTTSCGRDCPLAEGAKGKPFTSRKAKAAHKAREKVMDGGEEWYAPRAARAYLGVSWTTLVLLGPTLKREAVVSVCIAPGGRVALWTCASSSPWPRLS